MTWEETIVSIREQPEFQDLVKFAYFDEDLVLNVKRFKASEEYAKTLAIIKKYAANSQTLLDVGSGNGVSCVNFALSGFKVTSVEPDKSETVGAGAIRKLKEHFKLDGLEVYDAFAEDINFPENSFDIVYVRQAMHHANNLEKFVAECVRVLKPNGLLLTIRDHVVFNEKDKKRFLETHDLHKFYGGENAFSPQEYRYAITKAGAKIIEELKYFDSSINYFPLTNNDLLQMKHDFEEKIKKHLKKKIGILASLPLVFKIYKKMKGINNDLALDERKVPGRMYSYVAIKK